VRAIAAPPASPTPGRIAATSQAPPAAAAAAPAAPPATSALAGETPLLGEALTRLRQQHDARGALATLDQYRARYPNGTLKREAEGARIDALLLLGRNAEALTELRALTLRPAGRDQELRVIRGELSAASDCGRAVVDFDQVLAEQAPAPFVERALHGRAACRLRLGNEAGAIHDLSEYLQRFPQGRFAAEARRTLEGRRGDL
jgi:TolA-binding protein